MRKILYILISLFPIFGSAQVDNSPDPSPSEYNVDFLPEPWGGKREFKRFLEWHLVYPKDALKDKKEGIVTIKFALRSNGDIDQVKLTSGVSPSLDAEAMRLFNLLKWNPVTKDEKPVDVYWYLNIPFTVSDYKKYLKVRKSIKGPGFGLESDSSFTIYSTGVKNPQFLSHKDGLMAYLQDRLEYPDVAKRQNLQGTVLLEFIVETNGFISNLHIIKSVGGGCNEEALRVMGPTLWHPAIKDGKLVRCKMQVPIVFSLLGETKDLNGGSQLNWGQ